MIYGSVVSTLTSTSRPSSPQAEGPTENIMPRPPSAPLIQGVASFCCSGRSPEDPPRGLTVPTSLEHQNLVNPIRFIAPFMKSVFKNILS